MQNIENIEKILVANIKAYRVQLEPNYNFDFSGNDVTIINSIWEFKDIIKHIVFCDGK